MAFLYSVGCLVIVIVLAFAFQVRTAASIGCNFDFKVTPGVPIRLSNYGWRGGATTSCSWRVFSDTGVQLRCYNASIPSWMRYDSFQFLIYPEGNMTLAPVKNRGESLLYQANRNVMVVTLEGPSNIPEGTFNCQFEATSSCRCGWKNPKKIRGGEEIGKNEYPMVASVAVLEATDNRIDKEDLICGATIISSEYVVTAAHCIHNRPINRMLVVIGDHDMDDYYDTTSSQIKNVEKKIIHEYFNETKQNDIALLKINGSIEYTNAIGPACLPFNRYSTYEGQKVNIFGWGLTTFVNGRMAPRLQTAVVTVSNFEKCRSTNSLPMTYFSQICFYTEGKDACQNDSGGPVLWKDIKNNLLYLVGIISYGGNCDSSKPGYNTRVSSYIDWIKRNTKDTNANYCST